MINGEKFAGISMVGVLCLGLGACNSAGLPDSKVPEEHIEADEQKLEAMEDSGDDSQAEKDQIDEDEAEAQAEIEEHNAAKKAISEE
jgi:hypothetical protein